MAVYADEELHKALKAAASLQGLSLSKFMIEAAHRALEARHRKAAVARTNALRGVIRAKFSADEIRAMRDEGRRY